MLKACSYCGAIHSKQYICAPKQAAISSRQRKHASDKITRFRNSAAWQEARRQALQRDLHLCRVCFEGGQICSSNIQVHHIIPLAEDFSKRADVDNLITLCPFHHEVAEAGTIDAAELSTLVKSPPRGLGMFPKGR